MRTTINLMNISMKKLLLLAILLGGLATLPAPAQLAVAPAPAEYEPLQEPQLDQLLGPIALYPDPLIAQILPAATLPAQIVLADRYVSGGGDPNQIDQQPWDASVQAVARYPQVLKWLDDNLNWTTELGQAFLNQQQDVMDSIQRLRASAQNLGNLQSTPQQQVVDDGPDIEIVPADPEVIYIPVYSPDQVYDQSGFGISFGTGFPLGVWFNGDFDWQRHNLVYWDRDHPRPADWWHERPDQRDAELDGKTAVWRPEDRRGPGSVHPASRGDRGYPAPTVHSPAPVVSRPDQHPLPNHEVSNRDVPNHEEPAREVPPRNVAPAFTPRPEPSPVQRAAPANRPVSNGAFIGVQSSQQTRSFSDRGQQSMQTMPHSAPAPVSRPAGGGGGGGGHSSGSQKH